MSVYKPFSILHAFDPTLRQKHPHDEVYFVEGRYLDIASTKNKDPRTLYFGTSKISPLLTGIFLGDTELTSRVKDIQIIKGKDLDTYELTVKYINENNKLATVKTGILGSEAATTILKVIDEIKDVVDTIDSSITDIYSLLDIINSSIDIINDRLDTIDSSLLTLVDELETGKYNYTIRGSQGTLETGYKKIFLLFKGDEELSDSSIIEISDYALKQLEYNEENNELIASIWPDACGDTKEVKESTGLDYYGNETYKTVGVIPEEVIKTIKLDLNPFQEHLINKINTDSPINDRLLIVEDLLQWEGLFNKLNKS